MRLRMCTIYDAVLMLSSIYLYDFCSLFCSQAGPGCICSFHSTKSQFARKSLRNLQHERRSDSLVCPSSSLPKVVVAGLRGMLDGPFLPSEGAPARVAPDQEP